MLVYLYIQNLEPLNKTLKKKSDIKKKNKLISIFKYSFKILNRFIQVVLALFPC